MEKIKCNNCLNSYEGNFCNICGQGAIENQRLSTKEIFAHLLQRNLYFDRKLIYTFKDLFLRPEEVGLSFIRGQRKKYTKPIRYLIVVLAIYAILNYFFGASVVMEKIVHFELPFLTQELNHSLGIWNYRFYAEYQMYSGILQVLVLTAFLPFVFRKFDYNFMELLAANLYYFSTAILIVYVLMTICSSLFGYTLSLLVVNVVFLAYSFWAYYRFYQQQSFIKFIIKMVILFIYMNSVRFVVTMLFCVFSPIPGDVLH